MRYVLIRLKESQRESAYRIYVTDALSCINNDKHMTQRYYDLLHPPAEDNRTGDEIAADVIAKTGIKSR